MKHHRTQFLFFLILFIIVFYALIQLYFLHNTKVQFLLQTSSSSKVSSYNRTNKKKNSTSSTYRHFLQKQHHNHHNENSAYNIKINLPLREEAQENDKELRYLLNIRKKITRQENQTMNKMNMNVNDETIFSFPEDLEQRTDPDNGFRPWKLKLRRDGNGARLPLYPPRLETISSCYSSSHDSSPKNENSQRLLKFPYATKQSDPVLPSSLSILTNQQHKNRLSNSSAQNTKIQNRLKSTTT